ncbi:ABC_transporter family protein [Hexamita inflata]|uniref:ABC_transporter family protein n=1 Tax=Hexamita inflata TaxID=28002 RepID=A0ABP1I8Z8_9EUKA
MSEGLIVAQGTSLELKQKYGSGYTLTIIGKEKRKLQVFKNLFNQYLESTDALQFVKEVDNSGAVSTFSVSQQYSEKVGQLIKYLEQYVISNSDLQDFCFERTSMDEVFVNVGNKFQVANGAEIDVTELKDIETITQDGIQVVEYTNDESIDVEINQKNWPASKSKQDIRKILTPERSKPRIGMALLLKMAKKDKIQKFGMLSYIILPFMLLLIAFLVINMLLTKVTNSFNKQIDDTVQNFDKLCSNCLSLDVANLPIGQCEGYDAWGFPGLCEQAKILQKKQFQPNVTWYGGDQRVWQDSPNLYNLQEEQSRVLIFDKKKLLGKTNYANLISSSQKGYQIQTSAQYGLVTLNKVSYYYFNMQGTPVNAQIQSQLSQQLNNLAPPTSILDLFDVKPIAIQQRSNTNQEQNSFNLKYDLRLDNGYDYFENSDEFDTNTQKKLNKQRYVFSNKKLNHNQNCKYLTEDNQTLTPQQQQSQVKNYLKNNIACVYMDDKFALQDLNQQIAQLVPLGFINLDNLQQQSVTSANTFKPVISSFAPSRQVFYYNKFYQIRYKWINTKNYNQLIKADSSISNIKDKYPNIRRVPSNLPSIIQANDIASKMFSPQTALIDLSTRLGTAIMKNKIASKVNIRFGVQMFPHITLNAIDILKSQLSLILVTTLQVVASWCIIFKLGNHIVHDRQSGFRRQLYLNGVQRSHYFVAYIMYTVILSAVVQFNIYIIGRWIFKLQTFVRIDGMMYFLLAIVVIISTTCFSLFIASFLTKVSIYNIICILILVVTIITIMLNMKTIGEQPPWYSFILPPIGYAMLVLSTSYYGTKPSELFDNNLGGLLIEVLLYSVGLGAVGIIIDTILPVNGMRPFFLKQKQHEELEDDKFNGEIGVGIGDELKTQKTQTNIQVEEEVLQKYGHTQLNKFNAAEFNVKSPRDQAAFHQVDRMDIDVFKERQILKNGIPKNTPVVVSNIAKKFGDFLALRDLSFHIPASDQGCVFALLGPNGAAKTTTINLMTGLTQSDAGAIYLHGFNMNDQRQAEQAYKHIGLCSQFDVYLTELSVRDHLKLFAAIHGVKWCEINIIVQKLAGFVCLGEVLDKQVGQLSGGMRRRLSLALAIIG